MSTPEVENINVSNNKNDIIQSIIKNAIENKEKIRTLTEEERPARTPRSGKPLKFEPSEKDSFLTATIKEKINERDYVFSDLTDYLSRSTNVDKEKISAKANNMVHVLSVSNSMTDKTLELWLGFLNLKVLLVEPEEEND